jgi:FkbM family methyltransferase
VRRLIRRFLNKRGYEIIKQPYLGDIYPNQSEEEAVFSCITPIGTYFLPKNGLEEDAVTTMIARGRIFEPEIISTAEKYIKKGTSIIDIGANFGQMCIEFSKLTGESGVVHAFEAQNFVYNFLLKNISGNNRNNIKAYERAVWHNEGETLYFPEPDMSSPAPYSGNSVYTGQKTYPVKTITIDSLNIQEPISFMKVDIEGADIFALKGARDTILKNKMPIIFEYTQHMQQVYGTKFNDYVEFVNSIDYQFEEIVLGINYLILPK